MTCIFGSAERSGFTHTWSYDNTGNILERKAYAYTTGSLENANPQETVTYAYGDASWGDLLSYMEINGTPYYFTYAPDGTQMGIVEDDTPYFFELDLQGDIVGITSYTGYRVVEYTYDAWGNLLSCTGTRAKFNR